MKLLHSISYDIQNQTWEFATFQIKTAIQKAHQKTYLFQYQDIMNMLTFLLEHQSFNNHLAYTSICQYDENNDCIYTEMHISDWWWSIQEKLSSNATVVLLFLMTDKTVLTQHHENLTAWSIYVTIENLNHETWQKKTQSASVLLKFISIIKKDNNNLKTEIYHSALKQILKYKTRSAFFM